MGEKIRKCKSLLLLQKATKKKFTKEREKLFKLGTRMIHLEFMLAISIATIAHIFLKVPLYIIKELSFILLCLVIVTALYINRGCRSLDKMERAIEKTIKKELNEAGLEREELEESLDNFLKIG